MDISDIHSDDEQWGFPEYLRRMIEDELGQDEKLVWVARPVPQLFAMKALPIMLMGIPFSAFALFWMFAAAGFRVPQFNRGQDLFPLFGLLFLSVGIGMLCSPIWSKRRARRTAYVLTNRRAIIFEAGWTTTTVQSFGPEKLTELKRRQRRNGSGDLIFEERTNYYPNTFPNFQNHQRIGFLGVPDVKQVEDLVREVLSDPANRSQ